MTRRIRPIVAQPKPRPRGGYAPTRKLVKFCKHDFEERLVRNPAIGLRYIHKRCLFCHLTTITLLDGLTPVTPRPVVIQEKPPKPWVPNPDPLLAELEQVMRNKAAYIEESRVRR